MRAVSPRIRSSSMLLPNVPSVVSPIAAAQPAVSFCVGRRPYGEAKAKRLRLGTSMQAPDVQVAARHVQQWTIERDVADR